MQYDDAGWHFGGKFPADLPQAAGATHSGMFLAWALLTGLGSELHTHRFAENFRRLQQREMTPGTYFLVNRAGHLTDDDFNEVGNGFAKNYFELEHGLYIHDYEAILGSNLPSLYHVADTWENFDLLRPMLDARYTAWLASYNISLR